MEIYFCGKSSIDVVTSEGEKCFLCGNTTEYNQDGNCGVIIGDAKTMEQCGWVFNKTIDNLKIGEKYDSEEYGNSAFIIRLG